MPDDDQSILDWFEEGREARLCHVPKDRNPHKPREASFDAWNRGWDDANESDERAKGYG